MVVRPASVPSAEVLARDQRAAAIVADLVIRADGVADVSAYLVEPLAARRANAMFLHWFSEEPDSNRTQFVDEAVGMAELGVASVLPQQAFPWSGDPETADADLARIRAQLAQLAVAFDALVGADAGGLPGAIIGHDFGGMYGTILMAADERIRAGVVIAAVPRWADWFLPFWRISGDRYDYLRALAPVDPIEHIARAAERPLLLQFAEDDWYIAGMTAFELQRAAGKSAEVKTYPADHAMRVTAAAADRRLFLVSRLGLE